MRKLKVLSQHEVNQFEEKGYVMLRGVFSSQLAAHVRAEIWREMRLSPDDPAGWTQAMIHVKKYFTGHPYDQAFPPRFHHALDELMGEGRWWKTEDRLGMWFIAFPGHDPPQWVEPNQGWHIEGSFHHFVDSPMQGILPIFLFSDIGPKDGGTLLSLGSHKIAARVLAEAGETGLEEAELNRRVTALHQLENVIEVTGKAGDVALIHPFMLHTRGVNRGNSVRFICNPYYTLKEPMNLNRSAVSEYSPVELAIVEALAERAR